MRVRHQGNIDPRWIPGVSVWIIAGAFVALFAGTLVTNPDSALLPVSGFVALLAIGLAWWRTHGSR